MKHPATTHILRFFSHNHLPPALAEISRPFAELALWVAAGPPNPETTAALRKLLEAKDCAVRAHLAEEMDSKLAASKKLAESEKLALGDTMTPSEINRNHYSGSSSSQGFSVYVRWRPGEIGEDGRPQAIEDGVTLVKGDKQMDLTEAEVQRFVAGHKVHEQGKCERADSSDKK